MSALARRLVLLAAWAIAGCQPEEAPPPPPRPSDPELVAQIDGARSTLAPEADAVLSAALDTLEAHSVWAGADWLAVRAGAYSQARGARTARETHDAVRFALDAVGERHGALHAPGGSALPDGPRLDPTGSPTPPYPVVEARPYGVGFVALPPFPDPNGRGGLAYAQRIHDGIAAADREPRCGWVLDLRRDAGDNLFLQLAAAGPLLGEGRAGYFVDPRARDSTGTTGRALADFGYADGRATAGSFGHAGVDAPVRLPQRYPNVAVLIGPGTRGAGEALAVAFKSRPKAQLFGARTAGAATLVSFTELPDRSWLSYSSLVLADRSGRRHVPAVEPDVAVDASPGEIPRAAERWLRSRPECQ